jgi:oxygen-dependent protoporphyrinogen oxidase
VVGAGISGLSAAFELVRRGLRPIVLEASARAGGLISTDRTAGFTIEAGADSMLAQKPAALRLCEELGLSSELQGVRPPGGAFVLRGHRLYPLPRPSRLGLPLTWKGLARYELLSPSARLRLAFEPFVPADTEGTDESVASFFARRFGKATVDLIAQPLLGGIHAGAIDRLSMRALFPRLLEAERRHGSVLRGLRHDAGLSDDRSGPGPAVRGFVALRSGMSGLVDALVRQLPDGSVRCQHRVERIEVRDAGWYVSTIEHAFRADAVVFAGPAWSAATLLAPLDDQIGRRCSEVPYVSTASIALAWPKAAVAHPLAGTGFVVARRHSDVRITACTWVSSKWSARAPDDSVLLRAFIGGAHDPSAADLEDEELVAVGRRDLGAVLGITAEPALARVYRWRNAGPQFTVGHLDRMRVVDDRLTGHPGLFVAGSGFHAVGIPDCIADGRAAGERAAAFVKG